jgi:hypothetical protein
VGGRNDKANRASSRRKSDWSSCPRASHSALATGTPGPPLSHSGRLSVSSETKTSAFSWPGSPAIRRATARQEAIDRANRGLTALAPCGSGRSPHARRPSSTACAIRVTYSPTSASGTPASCQAAALSTSEDGTASRRARLPDTNQVNGAGGSPAAATASSISRRVSASITTERTAATCSAATRASLRATIIEFSPAAAAASSAGLAARAMARRSRNGWRACADIRSASSTTPRTWPAADRTGTWWMLRSSMSSRTSPASRPAGTVYAGSVMTAETGVSGLRPAATTRERKSRSVTMPSRSAVRTSTALAPSAVIRCAAARIGSPAAHSSGGVRISVATVRCARSAGPASGAGRPGSETIDRATNWSTSGRASSGRTTSSGMRRHTVSSAARASKPVGSPEIIEACPNSSPGPSRSRTRPSWRTSTEPVRTIHRYSTGPAPSEKIVFPRGTTSVSVTAATWARSSAPIASNGGREPRKSAISATEPGSATGRA